MACYYDIVMVIVCAAHAAAHWGHGQSGMSVRIWVSVEASFGSLKGGAGAWQNESAILLFVDRQPHLAASSPSTALAGGQRQYGGC